MRSTLQATTTAVFAMLLALGSACSSSAESAVGSPESALNAGLPIPTDQAWAFEDGAIDRAEYAQAFDEFVVCAGEEGVEIIGGDADPDTGLINYGIPAEEAQNEIANGCYQRFFQDIDATFQTSSVEVLAERDDEAVQLLTDQVFPCLEKNGIEVPEVADPALAGDAEFMQPWIDLGIAGRC